MRSDLSEYWFQTLGIKTINAVLQLENEKMNILYLRI